MGPAPFGLGQQGAGLFLGEKLDAIHSADTKNTLPGKGWAPESNDQAAGGVALSAVALSPVAFFPAERDAIRSKNHPTNLFAGESRTG